MTSLTDGPLLWFLNRGSGIVVLIALTLSVALGALAADRRAGGTVPAFVPRHLHRDLTILALGLTAAHAITAVIDTFVDIRWWQALVPFGSSYQPLWLGLGTLAFDIMLLVALSTAFRSRLSHRAWHRLHLLGYATWPIALAHGAGIGTDASATWVRWLAVGCAAVVAATIAFRLGRRPTTASIASGTRSDALPRLKEVRRG